MTASPSGCRLLLIISDILLLCFLHAYNDDTRWIRCLYMAFFVRNILGRPLPSPSSSPCLCFPQNGPDTDNSAYRVLRLHAPHAAFGVPRQRAQSRLFLFSSMIFSTCCSYCPPQAIRSSCCPCHATCYSCCPPRAPPKQCFYNVLSCTHAHCRGILLSH